MSKKFYTALAVWFFLVVLLVVERASVLRVLVPVFALVLTAYLVWAAVREAKDQKARKRAEEIKELLKGDL